MFAESRARTEDLWLSWNWAHSVSANMNQSNLYNDFSIIVGSVSMVTEPCFLWMAAVQTLPTKRKVPTWARKITCRCLLQSKSGLLQLKRWLNALVIELSPWWWWLEHSVKTSGNYSELNLVSDNLSLHLCSSQLRSHWKTLSQLCLKSTFSAIHSLHKLITCNQVHNYMKLTLSWDWEDILVKSEHHSSPSDVLSSAKPERG